MAVNWAVLQNAVKTAEAVKPATISASSYVAPYEPIQKPTRVVEPDLAKASPDEDPNAFDDLTIEDLTSLFKNFKDLDRENQLNLVEYMKKIEKTNPKKVNELKNHIHGRK